MIDHLPTWEFVLVVVLAALTGRILAEVLTDMFTRIWRAHEHRKANAAREAAGELWVQRYNQRRDARRAEEATRNPQDESQGGSGTTP